MVRISVIIPTRNRGADLGRCLTGLAECVQRVPAGAGVELHQVVVVDDASTTPDALAPLDVTDLPVTVLRNANRLGAGACRNLAVDVAGGDVLAFLDDDAIPRGDWLLVAATVDVERPAITGRVLGFDRGLLSRARQARYDARYDGLDARTAVNFFGCGNGAVLADAFHEVGGFANEGVGGDNTLAVSLAVRGTPVRFEPDMVIAHRNRKGWGLAVRNAWSAGTNHPDRLGLRALATAVVTSAVGDTLMVREVNRALGVLHTLGRIAPRPRPGQRQTDRCVPSTQPVAAPLQPVAAPRRFPVGVLGLGYAGLPEAVAFAAGGHRVIGVDIKQELLATLRDGRSPLETVTDDEVRRIGPRLTVSDDARDLAGCSAVLVCVPTPLDADGLPDLHELRAASEAVATGLRPGQLVVIESTVHPGVTDSIIRPILERNGLRAGVHFSLAFSPERIDPGNQVFHPTTTPRVVGGLTPVCARRAGDLYRDVAPAVHTVTGLRVAEAAKILENTYRQVNLALVNEFAAYCEVQGIDVGEVIDAAATKPFGFQPFYPGVGVGGHCIPVDPMYLAHSGREAGVPLRIVELAQEINNGRPQHVADQCARMLAGSGVEVVHARVLVLGLAYKPDVADLRNTPAVPLIKALTAHGVRLSVHDPMVSEIVVNGISHKSVDDLAGAIAEADLVLVAQWHTAYHPQVLAPARLLLTPGRSAPVRAAVTDVAPATRSHPASDSHTGPALALTTTAPLAA